MAQAALATKQTGEHIEFIDALCHDDPIVKSPIPVSVSSSDGLFVAGFESANLFASGYTEDEAVDNLRDLVLDIFESLADEDPEALGPEPKRQFAVLSKHIGTQ